MKKIIIISIIIISLISIAFIIKKTQNKQEIIEEVVDKNFSVTIPEDYIELYKNETYYYIPKIDPTGNSGSITIYSYESDIEYSKDFLDSLATDFKEKYNYKINTKKHYKTPYYDAAYFELQFNKYNEIIYYILTGSEVFIIEALDYGLYPNIQKDLKTIVDSILI